MKKTSIIVILLIVFLVTAQITFAQDATLTVIPSPSPAMHKEIEYTLPYPGLLPDSPLYQIKTFRDNLISFFISNPLKKAEFDLLQADKRLAAGQSLFDEHKNNEQMISAVISKSGNYFDMALGKLQEAKTQGEETNSVAGKMFTAAQKHEEVLQKLSTQATGINKTTFDAEYKRAVDFEKKARSLQTK